MSVEAIYNDFRRGMNLKISPVELDKRNSIGEVILMLIQNMILDEVGILASRRGFVNVIGDKLFNDAQTSELPIRYLAPFKRQDGTEYLLAQAGDAWYSVNRDDKIFEKIQGGFVEDVEWAWDIFQDELYLCNGETADGLQKYDGTTWTSLLGTTNIPNDAKYVTSHKNHLFVASGDVLKHSPLQNADGSFPWNGTEAWLETGFLLEPYTGDITGIRSNGDVLAVCTESATDILTGSDETNFDLDRVDSVYGCTSHNTMEVASFNGIDTFIWLSDRGVVVCDREKVYSISEPIDPFFVNLNKDRFTYAVGTYYTGNDIKRDWYMLSVGTSSEKGQTFDTNNMTYCYNTRLQGWTYFDGMNADAMAILKGTDGVSTCYFGTKTGEVFEFDSKNTPYTDDGIGIDQTVLLKHSWSPYKRYVTMKLRMKYRALNPVTLLVSCVSDLDNISNEFQSISLDAYVAGRVFSPIKNIAPEMINNYGYIQKVISIYCAGRDVVLKLRLNQAGRNIAIHELAIEGNERGTT